MVCLSLFEEKSKNEKKRKKGDQNWREKKELEEKEKIDLKNGRKKGRQEEKTRAYKNVLKIYSPV